MHLCVLVHQPHQPMPSAVGSMSEAEQVRLHVQLGSSKNRAAPQDEEAAAGRVAGTGKGGVLDLNDQEQQDTQAATAAAAKLQP